MAESTIARRPTVVPDEISSTKIRITLLVDGLESKGKQGVKNGTIDLNLTQSGLSFTASLKNNKGQETHWECNVKKFPAGIDVDRSTWKTEKGKVVLELVKMEPMSWKPMLSRGLDQADSSDED